MRRQLQTPASGHQQGLVLWILLLGISLVATMLLLHWPDDNSARAHYNASVLAAAREALLASAVSYRDTHGNESHAYLQCPDNSGNGISTLVCGTQNVSVVAPLHWKTLRLPSLRDYDGACLWLALAGHAKNNPKTSRYNWDTPGQFRLLDAAGHLLHSDTPHARPLAVILAPSRALPGQDRSSSNLSECGNNLLPANFLEAIGAPLAGITDITLATTASQQAGNLNDRAAWLTSHDIFSRLQRRRRFVEDIDEMLDDLSDCLGNWPLAKLPISSSSDKGMGAIDSRCPAISLEAANTLRRNWEDNLLYSRPTPNAANSQLTLSGEWYGDCQAMVLFGGARRLDQQRADATQRNDVSMYLEAPNATLFPATGHYAGAKHFSATQPHQDLARCLHALPGSASHYSFIEQLPQFVLSGSGVIKTAPVNPAHAGLGFSPATSGGCAWLDLALPLAGRTWRLYYRFRYQQSDPILLHQRGYGHSLQLVRGDQGRPDNCGAAQRMGILQTSEYWLNPAATPFTVHSLAVETDIAQQPSHHDPMANHSAILQDGQLVHGLSGATQVTTACDGSASGCQPGPLNTYEESPTQYHNQRLEIHSGCNSDCSTCHPAAHGPGQDHVRLSIWLDCRHCLGLAADLERTRQPPSASRCLALDESLQQVYLGFTAGLTPAPNEQGVTLSDFHLVIP